MFNFPLFSSIRSYFAAADLKTKQSDHIWPRDAGPFASVFSIRWSGGQFVPFRRVLWQNLLLNFPDHLVGTFLFEYSEGPEIANHPKS